jgi:hypothetical protein
MTAVLDFDHLVTMFHEWLAHLPDHRRGKTSVTGQVLLVDFGIARLLDATQHTATGAMSGTPTYMTDRPPGGGCSSGLVAIIVNGR